MLAAGEKTLGRPGLDSAWMLVPSCSQEPSSPGGHHTRGSEAQDRAVALPGRGGGRDSSDREDASLSQPQGPDKGQRSKLPGGPGLGLTSLLSSRPWGCPSPTRGPTDPQAPALAAGLGCATLPSSAGSAGLAPGSR